MVEQRFIDYGRERQQQQIAQVEMLKQQAWQDVNQVVSILREKFGATRILVYGSLLTDRFSVDSDIDIAVEGVPATQFFEALATVNQGCDRWIDLKPIESLESYFWQRIQSQGIWVDETTEPS